MARVDIALATCDGADHLPEQLDSIVAQTHEEWRLLVGDDASTDRTVEILEHYVRQDERIVVLPPSGGRLGHAGNFGRILDATTAPYVALCDQDDVWHSDKVERSLAELQRIERECAAGTPALVFTDSTLVDDENRTLHDSFWTYTGRDPARATSAGRLLVRNVVSGHTMLFNAALRDAALPLPPSVSVIDHWIAVLAACVGRTSWIGESTARYRQHGANAIGARRPRTIRQLPELIRDGDRRAAGYAELQAVAGELLGRFGDTMHPDAREALRAFLALPTVGPIERCRLAHRHELLPRGVARKLDFVRMTARRHTSSV